MTDNNEKKWSVASVMNDVCNATKRHEAKVRMHISPSDIGKNYWDRYQKMTGVQPTNPFEDRVLRVFAAGDNVHMIMTNVFRAAGVLIDAEQFCDQLETEKTLKILGKYDAIAGGLANYEMVDQFCKQMNFNEFFTEKTIQLAKEWNEKYPEGAPKILYEFKSVNSQVFWAKKDYLQEAYPWHKLQCYAYLKMLNLPEGRVFYVSKDDWTTAEFPIINPTPDLDDLLKKDYETMSNYIRTKTEPPKPDLIVFNPKAKLRFTKNKQKYCIIGSYETNWEVIRSQYFTLLTGEKDPKEWAEHQKKFVKEKNLELIHHYKLKNNL